MSRRVRNWCDICRDLQPDIKCTNEGCQKKFHEACLRNVNLWQAGDEKKDAYICPDCREANTNEAFCYICKKELLVVSTSDKKKRRKPPLLDLSPTKEAERDTPQKGNRSQPADGDGDVVERDSDKDLDESLEREPNRLKKRRRLLALSSSAAEDDEEDATPKHPRRSTRMMTRTSSQEVAEGSTGTDETDAGSVEGAANKLQKQDVSDSDDFVLCDGCANSAHLRCLGMDCRPEDDTELWFCTECDPHSLTAASLARSLAERRAAALKQSSTQAASKTRLGNVDICYVCQKAGKLLGCDYCEQSFHPRCIDTEFLEFEKVLSTGTSNGLLGDGDGGGLEERWRCPICKGEDPLKNMGHKRMSRTAMLKLSHEWQTCIKQTHRVCRQNRDQFLWSCRAALIPFVSSKVLVRLRKAVGATEEEVRRRPRRRHKTVLESDQEETSAEEVSRLQRAETLRVDQVYLEAEKVALENGTPILKEGVQLKGYQVTGVGWLLEAFKHKAGAILADEMGLGKTIQCLAFLSALKILGFTGPHLIVVPLSTVGNWAREIRKFIPHMRFVKICGSRFERDHIVADPTAAQGLYDLYITTYETVVTEESFFCDTLSWQCLILDEAHRIKNESGRIRHSLDRVSANMRTLLTGTPLQNNIRELFTLLNFLFPDILNDSASFEQVFSKQDSTTTAAPELSEILDESAVQAVSSLLSKMMLRRTKDLVVKLPRKLEHDVWLPLSPVSAFWYSKLLQVSEAAFQQLSVKKLLGTVVKMRICCCHPRGLITRDVQLKKFREVFQGLGEDEERTIEQAANELLSLEGDAHIQSSSKMMALDKLLCHLHVQNLEVSEDYKRDYVQHCKDLYIQSHPLEPIAPVKHGKWVKNIKTGTPPLPFTIQAVGSCFGSEPMPFVGDNSKMASSEPLKETAPGAEISRVPDTEAGSEEHKGAEKAVESKPLSQRQQADRLRRERAAAVAAQKAKLDAEVEALEEQVVHRIKSSAREPNLFKEFMAEAIIPVDASIPVYEEDEAKSGTDTIAAGRCTRTESRKSKCSTDLAPYKSVGSSDTDIDDTSAHEGASGGSPVVDLSTSARVMTPSADNIDADESADCKNTSPQEGAFKENQSEKGVKRTPVPSFEVKTESKSSEKVDTSQAVRGESENLSCHKVLVFTQFQLVLDELESYCKFRGFMYLRLDGSTNKMIRELDIREFNSTNSTHLVYLICTRAGGVGINLVTANHVILYDEDWNPFIDLQAIDRAHRIGQKRDVHVWKLITEWTVEERMAFRRRQKLKLDKLLIHANTTHREADEEELDDRGDRFSVEEIRRLITHGKAAIQKACAYDNSLLHESLEDMLQRARRPLPDVIGEMAGSNEEVDTDGDTAEPRVSIAEALDPEERAECLVGAGPSEGAPSRTSTDEPDMDGDIDEVFTAEPGLEGVSKTETFEGKRSRRLRKRVPLIFQAVPQVESRQKQERKLVHDKRCFKCGSGVNLSDETADPLIPCHRCPKVYHKQGCLSMDALPKRTWTCPWHECCLCFRKGSQAGGLLIHCAECPTAFCFDCFPPEYRRYTPAATYYTDLTRRGYPVNADKLVLFLCSRCKALKEQQRRRALSKQQLDAELRKRREANLKAKLDATEMTVQHKGGVLIPEKRTADAKREFLARKKEIDDSEREWTKDIRSTYESLFPQDFLDVLAEKRQKQEQEKQAAEKQTQDKQELVDSVAPQVVKSTSKVVLAKMPHDFCKVCENCHLPGHEAPSCPFPAESEKKSIQAVVKDEIQQQDEEASDKIRSQSKRFVRSFCSRCGVSSRNHFRRHCEHLSADEIQEYNERKVKIIKFIEELKKATRLTVPPGMTINVSSAESCRRILQRQVDDIVASCLIAADLSSCVAGSTSKGQGLIKNGTSRSSRRRRRSDGEEDMDLSGVETDDPNYSPRRRTKTEEDKESEGSGADVATDDRRRRRPIPNFVELAGGSSAALNEELEEIELTSQNQGGGKKVKADPSLEPKRMVKEKRPLKGGESKNEKRKQARLEEYMRSTETPSRALHMSPAIYPNGPILDTSASAAGVRLPPSRWHAHSAQPLPSHARLQQPLYPPPSLWGPYSRFAPPGLVMPPIKWPWATLPTHPAMYHQPNFGTFQPPPMQQHSNTSVPLLKSHPRAPTDHPFFR